MKKDNTKFEFDTSFQLEILRYLLKDKEGGLIIKKIKPSYLVLIEHSLIAEGIFKFFKKKNKMPSKNILKEVIKELLESKNYVDLVTKDDIPNIHKIIDDLYSNPLNDSEYIREKIYQFSTYVEMKNLNDSFDLDNFEQYETYSRKIEKILQNSKPKKDDEPIFMIRDITERQFKRQAEPSVIPCPFRQLNDITNAGGYPEHSVNVILDKPKAKKTFFMVNLARGYLRMKKSVLYVDTENGKEQIMDRFIQSSINKTKKELYSGEYDKLEAKHLRKLARFGVELVVERVPAMITDCNYIRELIIKLRNQGINIKVLMVDYAGKLASIAGDKDEVRKAHECIAIIRAEPNNPHDPNAVAVGIDNKIVGYFDRATAKKFHKFLEEKNLNKHVIFAVEAMVVGGWADQYSTGDYGVKLDVPQSLGKWELDRIEN